MPSELNWYFGWLFLFAVGSSLGVSSLSQAPSFRGCANSYSCSVQCLKIVRRGKKRSLRAEGLGCLSLELRSCGWDQGRVRLHQSCVWILQKCHVPEECLPSDKCHFGIKSITRKMSNPPYTRAVSLFIPIFSSKETFLFHCRAALLYIQRSKLYAVSL